MKITLAQLDYIIGDFQYNLDNMLEAIAIARKDKSDLVVFGELATTGYPPRDFLEFQDFIRQSEAVVDRLRRESEDIAIVVGAPRVNPQIEGKDLFNSAYFLYKGKIKHVADKALLPTYDIFDEYRYFEPARKFKTFQFKGYTIAMTICEDIWNVGNSNPLYTICPLDEIRKDKPDLLINISASPFSFSHAEERLHTIRTNVQRYKAPMVYVNHCGAQTDIIFDGGSAIANAKGVVVDEMPYFQTCIRTYDLEKDILKAKKENLQDKNKTQLIHDALVTGIRDYFSKLGIKKAILGLSGGIDSAIVAVLAERALGAANVRVVLMPSQYSSSHSVTDARELAENLNIQYDIINIEEIYQTYIKTLAPQFTATEFNITEENLQARARGMLLMALSNKFGNVLLNTTNKSEAAVGYGTLYGDMCGGLAVLGDVYKTEVYDLANYINKDGEVIPQNIIDKAPSAELRPGQKDSDSLPPYEVLDALLYQYIEKRQGPSELIQMGFEKALVERVLKMVNRNEFKRAQVAPILRISNKAFGMGRRMPIVGKYLERV